MNMPIKIFVVNSNLSVGLFGNGKIYAIVGDEAIVQCVHVFLMPMTVTDNDDNIDSIISSSREIYKNKDFNDSGLDNDTLLLGHASNLQAWADCGYDSRILSSTVARPILAALAKHGDRVAKNRYMASIIERWMEGNYTSKRALIEYNSYELRELISESDELLRQGKRPIIDRDEFEILRNEKQFLKNHTEYSYSMIDVIIDNDRRSYDNIDMNDSPHTIVDQEIHDIIKRSGDVNAMMPVYDEIKKSLSDTHRLLFSFKEFLKCVKIGRSFPTQYSSKYLDLSKRCLLYANLEWDSTFSTFRCAFLLKDDQMYRWVYICDRRDRYF